MKDRYLTLLLMLPWIDAGAASFDCAKATSKVERLICADQSLSTLDDQLAAVYRQARAIAADDAVEPKASQRTWMQRRNACIDVDCVAGAYRSRIAELEDAIGQDLNAEAIAGEYERSDDAHDAAVEPATIRIRALPDGRVAVVGEALWIGNVERGNVNVGTLEGEFDLRAGVVAYRDGDDEWSCVLTLRFTRDALDVHEPRATCGGMNVRFGGRYSRH